MLVTKGREKCGHHILQNQVHASFHDVCLMLFYGITLQVTAVGQFAWDISTICFCELFSISD